MTMFWDRQNKPIEDTIEWAMHFEDPEYRIVAVDQDAEGSPMVSTIWQGLDLAHSLRVTAETAMIFETAYLVNGRVVDTWIDHSEGEAFHRHRMVCLSMLEREPVVDGGLKDLIVQVERERKSR